MTPPPQPKTSCPTLRSDKPFPIHTDRWLEIDLYWFDLDSISKSVDEFWERYHSLFENISGWKGIIINVGWTGDYIYNWDGNQEKKIPLPENMKIYPWFEDQGQPHGNSLEMEEMWVRRFKDAAPPKVITYEPWTYKDLKRLAAEIKNTALKKYQIPDIKVGTYVLGWMHIYGGKITDFTKRHPYLYYNHVSEDPSDWRNNQYINLETRLSADGNSYASYPNGIPEGTKFTEFFGKQWGQLSEAIGLDVIVLRDSCMGTGIYIKEGPYGKTAPTDPLKVKARSDATADLVKQTKIHNKNALVIGYSNAASGVADWRVNCFDLEEIAKQGYLDAWIDQTWAGAWNELGQRPENFWNRLFCGWTYQLHYMLTRAAVLAESNVHHYFLTETFDAWESWDIIHGAKERLKWGIWAYSHAAVKTPAGLKMPAGSYISWGNKGKSLLSEEDVEFLIQTTDAAIQDAQNTSKVHGPTLVYNRSAMEWMSEHRPERSIKEWIDEQAGTISKWSVPCISITRNEYLSGVDSDLFILQTPNHIKVDEKANILQLLKSGKPVAVFGSPAWGIDREVAEIIGFSAKDADSCKERYIATINNKTNGIYQSIPNTFPIYQPYTQNICAEEAEVIYSVDTSPCLIHNQSHNRDIIFWDPPEFSVNHPFSSSLFDAPLDQILGNPAPYVLTARLINQTMKHHGFTHVNAIEQYHPVALAIWQLKDGTIEILAGNLEEGINHTADKNAHLVLNLPLTLLNGKATIENSWLGSKISTADNKFEINLKEAESRLFTISLP